MRGPADRAGPLRRARLLALGSSLRLDAGRLRGLVSSPRARIVTAVFSAGLAIRIAFVVLYRPAFLGIPDSGTYIDSAHHALFSDVYETAGYSLFVRIVHVIFPHSLTVVIILQHGLGIATAGLLYWAVRRVTGSELLGLVPAVVVLFDGFGLWVEHTPLADPLFGFTVALALALTLAAREGSLWLVAAAGAAIAIAGVVRAVGLVLIPLAFVWLVWTRPGSGRVRARVAGIAVLLAPVCAVLAAYLLAQQSATGFLGLTQTTGRAIYARAATFADCSQFTPPSGTRALCETTPTRDRGSFNQYETGYPDRAPPGLLVNRSISPAWRVFGPPPNGNGKLMAFGLTAIVNQPLDYVRTIADDFAGYWIDDHHNFIAADATIDPDVVRTMRSYYGTGGATVGGLGFLRWYGNWIELKGWLVIALLLVPAVGFLTHDRARRQAAVLFAAAGWLLPLAAVATASGNVRYILPAYGPLATAAAIGLAGRTYRLPYRRLLRARAGT
jgi:hypothetical protein